MSDILIRGMELPDSCKTCPFEVFGDCYGGKAKRIKDIEDYMDQGIRHPKCPLLELPPHGDLIDADALKAKAEYNRKHLEITGYERELLWHYLDVSMAPVIVPASEEVE